MNNEVVSSIRQAIADLVAPLTARLDKLEQVIKTRFDGVDQKLAMILKFQSLETRLDEVERRLTQRAQVNQSSGE